MVILNTTYSVNNNLQEEWLEWMRSDFYDLLDNTNLVKKKVLSLVMVGEQQGNYSYSLQLYINTMSDYQQFEQIYLPQCEAKLIHRFGTGVISFSTLLKVL